MTQSPTNGWVDSIKVGDIDVEGMQAESVREKHNEDIEAARAEYNSLQVVKDGQWYQKGEMGWWGCSTDEMTQDEWKNIP
ncbi:hypothetical protein GW796_00025 [archaeon]|nr:hypothetical protein [archaeon]